MAIENYSSKLAAGTRVVFSGKEHDARNGQCCTVLAALPNPSQRPENQWYDVRFDDYATGRFLARYLNAAEGGERKNVA
jgi:hypothetical protein